MRLRDHQTTTLPFIFSKQNTVYGQRCTCKGHIYFSLTYIYVTALHSSMSRHS